MNANRHPRRIEAAFSLVEILVSTAILSFLMLVCVSALEQMQKSWKLSAGKVEQFREARAAFEVITRTLSQATLNSYWDYYYQATGTNLPPEDAAASPSAYVRHSELQFRTDLAARLVGPDSTPALNPGHAVFFQAPLGLSPANRELNNLLNARGYYVQFGTDEDNRPPFIATGGVPLRHRYRLMEYRPPAEQTGTSTTSTPGNAIYVQPNDWYQQNLKASSRAVAENIMLLILSPRVSDEAALSTQKQPTWLAPYYSYNSLDADSSTVAVDGVTISSLGLASQGTQHLLPPIIQVTMVAVDAPSAERWAASRANEAVDILTEAGAPFTTAASYPADLARLRTYLAGAKLNYRVFSTSIALRNAKWDGRRR